MTAAEAETAETMARHEADRDAAWERSTKWIEALDGGRRIFHPKSWSDQDQSTVRLGVTEALAAA